MPWLVTPRTLAVLTEMPLPGVTQPDTCLAAQPAQHPLAEPEEERVHDRPRALAARKNLRDRRTATMTFIPSRRLAALVTTCGPGRARAQCRQGLHTITMQAGDSARAPQPGCSTAHLDSAAACVDGNHAQAVCAGVRLHREHLRNQHLRLRAQAEHL